MNSRMLFPRPGTALSKFLDRNFFDTNASRLFVACIPLSICIFLLQNGLELVIFWLAGVTGIPSHLPQIQGRQSSLSWVSPLLLAPLVENLLCLLWTRLISSGVDRGRWRVPSIVAAIATAFHVFAYMEIVYASIFVNFLAMCALIHNVHNKAHGFWASVFVHALTNLLVLVQLGFATQ